jgi:hypothetical protein
MWLVRSSVWLAQIGTLPDIHDEQYQIELDIGISDIGQNRPVKRFVGYWLLPISHFRIQSVLQTTKTTIGFMDMDKNTNINQNISVRSIFDIGY